MSALLASPRTTRVNRDELQSPAGPKRNLRRSVSAEDPNRVAAFVFELDLLFDAQRYETQVARAAARHVASERGLDPLWTEVLALELARVEGARSALESLGVLWGEASVEVTASRQALATVLPYEEVTETLRTLRRRFKVVVATARPRAEAHRVLRALGLEQAFDAVIASENEGKSSESEAGARATDALRPAASLHARAALAAGEPVEACLWIGGSGSSLRESARAAGMRTVTLVPEGFGASAASPDGLVLHGFELVAALAAGVSSDDTRAESSLDPFAD